MRPFRNPETQAEVDANRDWKIRQFNFHPADREGNAVGRGEPDWAWTPAWQIDNFRNAIDVIDDLRDYQDIIDPFAMINRVAAPRRREEGMAANEKIMKMYKKLDLGKLKDGPVIERDIALPPFKVEYDSHEQINQKLNQTVILIKNNPFYVHQTCEYERGKFALLVSDPDGENNTIVHYDDVVDCRGIAPSYYNHRGSAWWIYRVPERQNSQGMSQRNMQFKPAGERNHPGMCRTNDLLKALAQAKDIKYAPNLTDLLLSGANNSLRLSSRVAIYQSGKKGAPIGVEYCGRPLGLVIGDRCKVLDETDLIPSWMHKDLAKVDLLLTA
jgi:hypothetical protein